MEGWRANCFVVLKIKWRAALSLLTLKVAVKNMPPCNITIVATYIIQQTIIKKYKVGT